MSRLGNKPLPIEKGVTVTPGKGTVTVSGPKGTVAIAVPDGVEVVVSEWQLHVKTTEGSLQGLTRALLGNAIKGVVTLWSKQLELVGVGFKATTDGSELTLNLGFSHPVKIHAPPGITFEVSENIITILGADKYLVGEIASKIRRAKPPEPYKGKGIRYEGEKIRKKLGKAAKAAGAVSAK